MFPMSFKGNTDWKLFEHWECRTFAAWHLRAYCLISVCMAVAIGASVLLHYLNKQEGSYILLAEWSGNLGPCRLLVHPELGASADC